MGKESKYPDGTTPKICIIGAGFSGLTAGIQLKRKLNLVSFTIYDENHDIGGTWLVNTYPGVACDIPSHFYSLSFELNPDWTQAYSSSEEILRYIKTVAHKYDIIRHVTCNTLVTATVWNEVANLWDVTLYNKETKAHQVVQFDIVITGTGLLRAPCLPPEFKAFNGPVFHTAEWDPSIDLTNKVVGVVGCGSSAIQVIPELAKIVNELHCYQRHPPHVATRPQETYSAIFKTACKYFPPFMWMVRLMIFFKFELFHWTFFPKSKANKFLTGLCKEQLNTQIENKELREKLVPGFPYGCKRVLFHDEYYPALQLPHVHVHREKIQQILDKTIVCADGTSTNLDFLILATGFKSRNYLDPMKIVGTNGVVVNQLWKEDQPSSYLGIITHSAPNQFLLLGPNTLLGHSSVIYMMECQVNYVIEGIRQMMAKNIKVLKPKKEIEEKYMEEIHGALMKMVWSTGNCQAWYSNARGNVTALWPYNCLSYWNRTRNFNLEDYETISA